VSELLALQIADPPDVWRDLGFAVVNGVCTIDGVHHALGVAGHGIVAWSLGGLDGVLGELPTAPAPSAARHDPQPQPNGVTALDHIVVATPDLERTIAAFEEAGLPLRRRRQAGGENRLLTQAFFKLGPVVVEVVGSLAASGSEPATFWGLAYTVADLDATAAFFGPRLRPVKTAVQEGRRIATLDRDAGSSVPIAFMSPPTST
jgi:catechol 2,3-dioxygenase-like lactoylglutathione lyase family enzyme